MKLKLPTTTPDQDYRIFFIFMTVVMVGAAIWSLAINPGLREPLPLIVFTTLMATHIILHWNVNSLIQTPTKKTIFIIGQGALAFVIVHLSGNVGMIFALYMALIGETIGILGLSRWSLLAGAYYLGLSMVNFNILTAGGNPFGWILTTIPVVFFVSMYVLLYTRQTEAREKAQALAAELESANRQLSEYAARVEDLTITAERQRMARELHDTLSQGLAGLILQLEAADARLSQQHPEKARSIITQAMENARATLTDARQAISNLRENHLEELGDSLRLEISRFESATGIPCLLHAEPTPPLPDPVKESVLRTVSEALTNIARHAQASEVTISLVCNEQIFTAAIKDNGLGFDPAQIPSGHYGLLGIRERIRLIGGTFTLESAPQAGTTLTIQIPLHPTADTR
ncbi:MAG: sensor histidine kinase [Chloroflexi bacterium HGW-Chloroflexi-6]|nr:MAG: sensor histidine kinase [Chloroflexi bacterium HGW-Chloroflexi-6]